jgi:hypothetical protein
MMAATFYSSDIFFQNLTLLVGCITVIYGLHKLFASPPTIKGYLLFQASLTFVIHCLTVLIQAPHKDRSPYLSKKELDKVFYHLIRILLGPLLITLIIYTQTQQIMPLIFWFSYFSITNLVKPLNLTRTGNLFWYTGMSILGMSLAIFFGLAPTLMFALQEGLSPQLSFVLKYVNMGLSLVPMAFMMADTGIPSPPSTPGTPSEAGNLEDPEDPQTPTEPITEDPYVTIVNRYVDMTRSLRYGTLEIVVRRGTDPFVPAYHLAILPPSTGLVGPASQILALLQTGYVYLNQEWADGPADTFGQDLMQLLEDFHRLDDSGYFDQPSLQIRERTITVLNPREPTAFIPLTGNHPRWPDAAEYIMASIGNYMAQAVYDGHHAFSAEFIHYIMENGLLALNGIPFQELEPVNYRDVAGLEEMNTMPSPMSPGAMEFLQNRSLAASFLAELGNVNPNHYWDFLAREITVVDLLHFQQQINEMDPESLQGLRVQIGNEFAQRHHVWSNLIRLSTETQNTLSSQLLESRLQSEMRHYSNIIEMIDIYINPSQSVLKNEHAPIVPTPLESVAGPSTITTGVNPPLLGTSTEQQTPSLTQTPPEQDLKEDDENRRPTHPSDKGKEVVRR